MVTSRDELANGSSPSCAAAGATANAREARMIAQATTTRRTVQMRAACRFSCSSPWSRRATFKIPSAAGPVCLLMISSAHGLFVEDQLALSRDLETIDRAGVLDVYLMGAAKEVFA